jgi:hypothetical protein
MSESYNHLNKLVEDFSKKSGISMSKLHSAGIDLFSNASVGVNTPVGGVNAGERFNVHDGKSTVNSEEKAKIAGFVNGEEFVMAQNKAVQASRNIASRLEDQKLSRIADDTSISVNRSRTSGMKYNEAAETLKQAGRSLSHSKQINLQLVKRNLMDS